LIFIQDLEKIVEVLEEDMKKLQNSHLISQDKYEGMKDEVVALEESVCIFWS
jgi:hypothetical protein